MRALVVIVIDVRDLDTRVAGDEVDGKRGEAGTPAALSYQGALHLPQTEDVIDTCVAIRMCECVYEFKGALMT